MQWNGLNSILNVDGNVQHSFHKYERQVSIVTYGIPLYNASNLACVLGANALCRMLPSPRRIMLYKEMIITCMKAEPVLITENYSTAFHLPGDLLVMLLETCTIVLWWKWMSGENHSSPYCYTWAHICSGLSSGHSVFSAIASFTLSILVSLCTIWSSRTWSTGVEIFTWLLLAISMHHWFIMSNMHSNSLKWTLSHLMSYNPTCLNGSTWTNGACVSLEQDTCLHWTLSLLIVTCITV